MYCFSLTLFLLQQQGCSGISGLNEQSHSVTFGITAHLTPGTTASEELQNWLKSRIKFDGLWGKYRVVSTSCMGVCPQSRVVVVLRHDAVGQQCFIVRPQGEREIFYSYIKQMHKY
ncbi:hypothetical protein A6S26_33875 [Nostoc sp. ATCC 43529]|nr:hypothetical protein A6S26_33875 [Nostoc sp. ATCC 43529]